MSERLKTDGHIEVIAGGMFCGKTEELQRRVRRATIASQQVQFFKPIIDTRYAGVNYASSHNGNHVNAEPVTDSRDLMSKVDGRTEVIAIDEVQFLDSGIVRVIRNLANAGVRVIGAGLNTDFLGRPFGPMPELLAEADEVDIYHAICKIPGCKEPASRTQRIIDGEPARADSPLVLIGEKEAYEARCRVHHEVQIDSPHGIVYASPDVLRNEQINYDNLRREPFIIYKNLGEAAD